MMSRLKQIILFSLSFMLYSIGSVAQSDCPQIGLAKSLSSMSENANGSFSLVFEMTIQNLSSESLTDLRLYDNVKDQFANALVSNFNTNFSGNTLATNPNWKGFPTSNILSSGQSIAGYSSQTVFIGFDVAVDDSVLSLNNQASVTASFDVSLFPSTCGEAFDESTDGTNPDPNGSGEAEENLPTSISFPEPEFCQLEEVSSLLFSMDDCLSFAGDISQADYSEFVATSQNVAGETSFEVVGGNLYRNNPYQNPHSCTPGVSGSAMCVGSLNSCEFESGSDKAVRFDIQVNPGNDGEGQLSCLSFYQSAPQYFNWIDGSWGLNNLPRSYGIRVLVGNNVLYEQTGIPTTLDYTFQNFDFTDIPGFTVSETTVFTFELLAYCTVGNGSLINAWDLDEIQISYKERENINGGAISFDGGVDNYEVCIEELPSDLGLTVNGAAGSNSNWILTDTNGEILRLEDGPSFPSLAIGEYSVYHVSYVDITGLAIGQNISDLEGCFGLSNPLALGVYSNPTVSISSVVDATCGLDNGSISITASSDNVPNTYAWSNGSTTMNLNDLAPGNYSLTVTNVHGCSATASATIDSSVGVEITVTSTNTTCGDSNGTATVSVVAGNGGYTYDWSNDTSSSNLSGLAAGNYIVTVTDSAGCSATENVTIGASENPVVNISSLQNTSCGEDNGSVALQVTGGYTYDWSNGATSSSLENLAPGNYSVTITDAAGCSVEENIEIEASSAPIIVVNATNTTCGEDNGNITTNTSMGSGGYTYMWSNGSTAASQSNLSAGNYTVTVTDSEGCTDVGTASVGASDHPTIQINSTNTECGEDDGSISASATGGSGGYTFMWSNGSAAANQSNLPAGNYSVTVTDSNGCTDAGSVNVGGSANTNNGGNIQFTGGASNYKICLNEFLGDFGVELTNEEGSNLNWILTDNNGNILNVSQGTASLPDATPGEYLIYHIAYDYIQGLNTGQNVSNLTGCFDLSNSITVSICENPVITTVTVEDTSCGMDNGSISIVATTLNPPNTYAWSNGSTEMNPSGLAPGTYTVTVTNSNGCTGTASAEVGDSEGIEITSSSTNTSCGESNGSVNVSVVSGNGGYTYAWSNGSSSASQNNIPSGTYSVTVTDSEGCTDVETVNVGASETPTLNVVSVNDTSCGFDNGSAIVSASGGSGGYTYMWSNGASATSLSDLPAGTYNVTVTDAAGCTDEVSFTIESSSSPITEVGSQNTSCGEDNGSIDLTVSGGSGTYTYTWSNGASAANLSSLASGSYSFTVTDAAGCTDFGTINIEGSESPMLNITSIMDTSCGEDNGSVSISATGGSGGNSFSWSNGASSASEINLSSGTYSVTVTDVVGCTDVITFTIQGSTAPIVSLSSTDTTCGEVNGGVSATTNQGVAPYSYLWSNGSTASSQSNIDAGSYSVTVTDAEGCTDIGSVNVGASESPTLVLSAEPTECGLDNGSVNVTATGGIGAYTYDWSNGSNSASQSNLSADTYTVTVTDAVGCESVESVTVGGSNNLSNGGDISFSGGQLEYKICLNEMVGDFGIELINENGLNYRWILASQNGEILNIVEGIAFFPDATVGEYQIYHVAYDYIDGLEVGENISQLSGCYDLSNAVTISICENPVATIDSVEDSSCGVNNGSINISVSSSNGPNTFDWSNGSSQMNLSDLAPGTYTVTVTNSNGCTGVATTTVESSIGLDISQSSTNTSCGESNGTASVSVVSGNGGYSYTWSNGSSSSAQDNLAAGTYTVTVTDAEGCTAVGTFSISESTSPTLAISGVDTSCGEDNGSATVSVTNGNGSYDYLWSNGSEDPMLSSLAPGNYSVTVTDENDCQGIANITIGASSSPTLDITETDTSCGESNGALNAVASGGTGGYTFNWSNGGTAPVQTNLIPGTYEVTVTDSAGCSYVASMNVGSSEVPVVSLTAINTTCELANGSVSSSTINGVAPYTYEWSNGSNATSIDDLAAGVYTITVTDQEGCSAIESIEVLGSTNPVVSVDEVGTSCGESNGSVLATATGGVGGYTYEWSNGVSGDSQINLAAGVYSVTVTDANNCTDVSIITIGSSSNPSLDISVVNTSCGEDNGALTVVASGGTGVYTYLWSNGGTEATQVGLDPGTFSVTVTDSAGCSVVSDMDIDSSATPEVVATSNPTSCGETNGSVNTSVTQGIAPYSYLWSNGSNEANQSNLPSGGYTVTVTDAAGCSTVADVFVESSSGPTVSIEGDDTYCGFANGSLNAFSMGGSGGYTYAWSNGANGPILNDLAAGNYSVTVTDSEGCTDETSFSVGASVNENSGGIISCADGNSVKNICEDDADLLFMALANNSGANSSWIVTDQNGLVTSVSGNPIDISLLPQGNYTIQHLSYDNTCGQMIIDTDQNVVGAGAVTLDLEDANCASLATFFVDPVPPTGTFNLPIKEFTITIAEAGFYNFTPAQSCDYVFNLYPLGGFNQNDPCSTNNLLAFGGYSETNMGFVQNGGAYLTPGDYQLIICSTLFACTDNIANGALTISCLDLAPGGLLTDLEGCYDISNPVALNINPQPSLGLSNISHTTCGQNNGSATVNATGGSTGYSYSWSNGGVGSSQNNLTSGIYTVTVTDVSGCTDVTSLEILPSTELAVSINAQDEECTDATGSIALTVTSGTPSYQYNWSNGATSASLSGLSAGQYSVTVSDAENCSVVRSVTINNITDLEIAVTGEHTCCGENNGSVNVTYECAVDPVQILWSNGETTAQINDLAPGLYTVTVTDNTGQSESGSFTVLSSTSPNATATAVGTTCGANNGSAMVSAVQGTLPYTYQWSNGASTPNISGLPAGNYTVTVTDAKGCESIRQVVVDGSITPDAGILTGGPFYFCVDDMPDFVDGIEVNNAIGTNGTFVVTNAAGEILGLPETLAQLESIDFNEAGVGECYIWYVTYEDVIINLAMGSNANALAGCYDIVGPIEVNRINIQVVNPKLTFDLNACAANNNFDEFDADFDSYPGCTSYEVIGGHLEGPNSHSCTPGFEGVALCISAENGCAYDPSTTKKITIPIRVTPGSNGIGSIEQLTFHEQAPYNFVWTDGTTGANNYPSKLAVRILKGGTLIFEETEIPTSRTWNLNEFDFTNNPDFIVNAVTDFTIEFIPYCADPTSSVSVSIWDIDNIMISTECEASPVGGFLSGGPYSFCKNGNADYITDLQLSNFLGTSELVLLNSNDVIVESFSSFTELSNYNLDGLEIGNYQIVNVSYYGSTAGIVPGNDFYADVLGCMDTSNPINIEITDCVSNISVFPNPTSTNINLQLNVSRYDKLTYQIFDQLGQEQFRYKSDNNLRQVIEIDLSSLRPGTYMLKVNANGFIKTKQIVIVN